MSRASSLSGRVRATLSRWQMLGRGDRVLVACSGGPDSLALLDLLRLLGPRLGFRLRAIYVDHGLRAAAAGEGERVVAEAARRGLAAEVVRVRVEGRSMDAARRARLAALEAAARARGANRLALGHTLSDQAETVLMRLLRGTGLRGLAGIPPVRALGPDLLIIRPLLEISRDEIEAYVRARRLEPVRDPTNRARRYLRNRVRGDLLPRLRRESPAIEVALARLADETRALDAALERAAGALDARSIEALRDAPPALRARALGRAHLRALEELLSRPGGQAAVSLPGGVRAERRYGQLAFVPAEIRVEAPGVYRFGPFAVEIRTARAPSDGFVFDAETVPLPWTLRGPRPGDRLRPRGLGGQKKLQDLFVDAKIPRAERPGMPVLERKGEILCVGDLRAAEAGRPLPSTRSFFEVVLTPCRGV